MYEITMQLPFNGFYVKGILSLPVKAQSIVIFSHGFGSTVLTPHEQKIARKLQKEGFGTLMFDLLNEKEELPESYKDIDLLSRGLITATNWLHGHSDYRLLNLGYFGSGTGAAIALKAASELGSVIKATVLLSGRLDKVKQEPSQISSPVLLIAGEYDFQCMKMNKEAFKHLQSPKQLAVVPGASHLFEEPGKIKEASAITISWFNKFLQKEVQPQILQ